jgi:hypothetical protein
MAKALVFEFQIKTDDGKSLKPIKVEAKNVNEALMKLGGQAEKATKKLRSMSNIVILDGVQSAVQSLQSAMQGLTRAYAIQQEAETKLASNMRNTIGASDAEIQSIKDLCSAQQQLGVIGDEVQLAGAQELAVHVRHTETLKTLIPAMNDMIAKEKGLSATQESATNIAKMLGKVMDGQVTVLRRYGITASDAQLEVLKLGTEEERAAVLSQLIADKMGGVNRELAKTSSGQVQQLTNAMGDLGEQVGGVLTKVQPYVAMAAQLTTATTGFIKLTTGIKGATTAFMAFNAVTKASIVGGIVAALAGGMAYLSSVTGEATESVKKLTAAEQAAADAAEAMRRVNTEAANAGITARTELEKYIGTIENFKGTKVQEKKLVDELNAKYGTTMGYFRSLSEWYKALKANSEAYCKQLVNEAKARLLADQIAKQEMAAHDIVYDENGNKRQYDNKREVTKVTKGSKYFGKADEVYHTEYVGIAGTSEVEKKQAEYNQIIQNINHSREQLQELLQQPVEMPVMGSATPVGFAGGEGGPALSKIINPEGLAENFTNLQQFENRLSFLRESAKTASHEQLMVIQEMIEETERLKDIFEGKSEDFKWGSNGGTIRKVRKLETTAITIPAKIVAEPPKDLEGTGSLSEEMKETVKASDLVSQSLGGVSSIIGNLSGTLGESAGAWTNYIANILQSVSKAIPALTALTAAKAAASAADVPIIGYIAAGAAIASVLASFAALPKFAEGGIAYGPTVGLFGEYPGAANNPEVVAPLNKLQSLIEPAWSGMPDSLTTRVSGRDLEIILRKWNRFKSRI